MTITTISTIIGIIGGSLGITSFILGRIERHEKLSEEKELIKLYTSIAEEMDINKYWEPRIGTKDHKLAMRMADRGWLTRHGVGFMLPIDPGC